MLIIDSPATIARALDSPLASNIKHLLTLRRDLIDLATFVIATPGDSMADIEAAAGIPIATNLVDGSRYGDPDYMPSFEWALDHGGVYELPFILSDDGAAVVLIVPDSEGIDPVLLSMARDHAEKADPAGSHLHHREQPTLT